jgi:molecular chaperone DnaK
LKKEDLDDIKAKKEKLNETLMALGAKLYENKGSEAQGESSSEESSKKDNNVKDAEYEEK